MRYCVTPPRRVSGVVSLPASKSVSNRVLLINALTDGACDIRGAAECDDTTAMIAGLSRSAAGAAVTDVHGAGTSMRFLTACCCLREGTCVITGSARMLSRPIGTLVDALRSLGARIEYLGQEGFPPLRITGGGMKGGRVKMQASVSSQFASALLLIAPRLPGGLTLELAGEIASRPYIDMTLRLMREFGAKASWTGDDTIAVEEGRYTPRTFHVESDWSAASYWYEAVLLSDGGAGVLLKGLREDSVQGDIKVTDYFGRLGVSTSFTDEGVMIEKRPEAAGKAEFDLRGEPDLAQTLAVACAMAGVRFEFSGLDNLKIKETDRLAALENEMRKLGFNLRRGGAGRISWDGSRLPAEESPVIRTYGDHRMAMSFAPASLKLGKVVIEEPRVVEKSYPRFWDDLAAAGFKINPV